MSSGQWLSVAIFVMKLAEVGVVADWSWWWVAIIYVFSGISIKRSK